MNFWVSANAASALGKIGSPEAQQALIAVLSNKKVDSFIRGKAASAIGKIGSQDTQRALIEALKDEKLDSRARADVASALGKIGSQEAQKALLDTLADEKLNGWVEKETIFALGGIEVSDVLPKLILLLKNKIQCHDAAEAIGWLQIRPENWPPYLAQIARMTSGLRSRWTKDAAWEAIFEVEDRQGVRWVPPAPWWRRRVAGPLDDLYREVREEFRKGVVAGVVKLLFKLWWVVVAVLGLWLVPKFGSEQMLDLFRSWAESLFGK